MYGPNRRDFLKFTAGLAALAKAAAPQMYVSLNGSVTNGKVAWPEFARLAASIGFGGVDVNLPGAMKEGAVSTQALFAELKIKASNTNLPVVFAKDENEFQSTMAKLKDAAEFCAAIHCPTMLAVLPPASATPKPELHKILRDRISAIAEILQASNVRLAMEFLGPLHFRTSQAHEFIYRMDEALAFTKECGANVGLLLDVWHWHHSGATKPDISAAGSSHIFHVHLSDCPKLEPQQVRDNQRVLPGEGVIDLTGFFQALKDIGYHDGVSPEPIGRFPKDTPPEDGARQALETAKAAMRRAGVA